MRLLLWIPVQLVKQIDELAGDGGRDLYIRDAIEQKLAGDRSPATPRKVRGAWRKEGKPEE